MGHMYEPTLYTLHRHILRESVTFKEFSLFLSLSLSLSLSLQGFCGDGRGSAVCAGGDVGVRLFPVSGGGHCGDAVLVHSAQQPAGGANLHHALFNEQSGEIPVQTSYLACVHNRP